MNKLKKLYVLFISTFSISATTNGGYAILAVMKEKFVKNNGWLTEEEMLDLISIGQLIPGPMAINTSVLAGYKIAGFLGSIVTLLGTILPPLIIMTIVTIFYENVAKNVYVLRFLKGMQAAVAALLVNVFIDMFINISKKKSIIYYSLAILAFIIVRYTNISIFYLALFSGIVGFLKTKLVVKEVKNG